MTETYIFRWKENGIEVWPSVRKSPKEVWDFAVAQLRPASMTNDEEAEKFIRRYGEVIPRKE